eukprot:TRINITY_DN16797_c0_g1_i1.p2 TRINITY_DN16797_c0_g1~~TRINITY_DN16797_c0_g1_i1.p2  ORF type:complete len:140 (-),score=56.89 TRINITY_DN16797_c0_g1_i1:117-512(-)
MASADLTWMLVRKNNKFLVKRNGIALSNDPQNLTNVHSYSQAGFVNNNAVGLQVVDNKVVLTTKSKRAGRRQQPSKSLNKTVLGRDFRRNAKTIKNNTDSKFYRRDLTKVALARYTKLQASLKPKATITKA